MVILPVIRVRQPPGVSQPLDVLQMAVGVEHVMLTILSRISRRIGKPHQNPQQKQQNIRVLGSSFSAAMDAQHGDVSSG